MIEKKERVNIKQEKHLKPSKSKPVPYKVKIGDHVRISYKKRAFERVYDSKFSGEVFVVAKRYRRQGRPVYRLKDLQDELLEGAFNNNEIQRVKIKSNPKYTIEKILKNHTSQNLRYYYVITEITKSEISRCNHKKF